MPISARRSVCSSSNRAQANRAKSSSPGMKLPPLDPREYQDIVRRALDEDLVDAAGDANDVTTDATVPAAIRARGRFIVNADCVVAGLDVAFECFRALEPEAEM